MKSAFLFWFTFACFLCPTLPFISMIQKLNLNQFDLNCYSMYFHANLECEWNRLLLLQQARLIGFRFFKFMMFIIFTIYVICKSFFGPYVSMPVSSVSCLPTPLCFFIYFLPFHVFYISLYNFILLLNVIFTMPYWWLSFVYIIWLSCFIIVIFFVIVQFNVTSVLLAKYIMYVQ